jgi:hypothetical protein
MNKHARNSQYFATTKECRRRINQFFTSTLPKIVGSLSCTINDNFQQFRPAFRRCLGISYNKLTTTNYLSEFQTSYLQQAIDINITQENALSNAKQSVLWYSTTPYHGFVHIQ